MFAPIRILTRNNANLLLNISKQCNVSSICNNPKILPMCVCLQKSVPFVQNRFKSKKSKNRPMEETETEHEPKDFSDSIPDKHIKVMKVKVTSLRLDALLKSCLGIARNKVEILFYESKIRLNGKKIVKKSLPITEGDEIDVIKGESVSNPDFLVIARVEVLSITAEEEAIVIKARRNKSLTIEKYDDK